VSYLNIQINELSWRVALAAVGVVVALGGGFLFLLGMPGIAPAPGDPGSRTETVLDFRTRNKDAENIDRLLTRLKGFWEVYHFAFSREDVLAISLSLLIVRKKNRRNFIECEMTDRCHENGRERTYFDYKGYCFPIQNSNLLYFVLDEIKHGSGIATLYTSQPYGQSPKMEIEGVSLGTSGGVNDSKQYPAAAKVAFRYIGQTSIDAKKYCSLRSVVKRIVAAEDKNGQPLNDVQLEEILSSEIGGYIELDEMDERQKKYLLEIIGRLGNEVAAGQIPFVLRNLLKGNKQTRSSPE